MSFFSRKDNDDLFSLLEIEDENDSFINSGNGLHPDHVLTPDEIIGFGSEDKESGTSSGNALDLLKKRMREAQTEPKTEEKEQPKTAPEIRTAEPSEPDFDLDSFLISMSEGQTEEKPEDKEPPKDVPKKEPEKTLLEKCRPYIIDDNGSDSAMKNEKTYKLESVADILKSESEKALERLSSKYEVSFDDLGKTTPKKPQVETPTVKEEPKVEKQVFEDIIPTSVNNIHTNVPHIISDIDSESSAVSEQKTDFADTSTIKFTPVSDSESASRISISSKTRAIDLTGEITSLSDSETETEKNEIRLEQTEFEEFVPEKEFSSEKDTKLFLRMFSLKKRSNFLKTVGSGILLFILTFAKLPFMSELILAHTKTADIICTVILGIILLINIDMFKSFAKIVSRKSTPDIIATLSSLTVISYGIAASLKNEIATDIIILGGFTLFVRALSQFFGSSYILSGFKQISGNTPKRGIKLISDTAITFAMAKNSIEGDVLVAAPQKTDHIDGYMKYSTFKIILTGRLPVITLVSVLLSAVLGIACATYFDGAMFGLYSAAAIQCFAATPVIFLIDNLPLYSASKKLAKSGAMIAGKMGAEKIENANATVLNSSDIFPSGTVSLHQMKILSENTVDDTIIRAASLTDALDSPLSPIFKKIAGTGGDAILPKSDTVKYEDRMGISGWVDNKLLFIGNRTLMEAHGISVPSVETDRKILRQGFFPVYVASDDKACALLIVKYSVRPEIAKALRQVSALGVTMLINNTDPNMTEEMICDYMGLYDDTVKVMSAAGCHMYKNAVTFTDSLSAPAAYKGNPIGLAAIIASAGKIKKSNILLTVMYVLSAVIGTVLFTYKSFDGSGSLMTSLTVLLYNLICAAVTVVLYFTQKP